MAERHGMLVGLRVQAVAWDLVGQPLLIAISSPLGSGAMCTSQHWGQ